MATVIVVAAIVTDVVCSSSSRNSRSGSGGGGSRDQFPESHTIIWKGQGKANSIKVSKNFYPSVQGSRVTNRSSFRICRIHCNHLHHPEEMVKIAQRQPQPKQLFAENTICLRNPQIIIINMGGVAHNDIFGVFLFASSHLIKTPPNFKVAFFFNHFTDEENEVV